MARITETEVYEQFDNMLDGMELPQFILNLGTAYILKNLDEVCYDEEFNNWIDSELRDGTLFQCKECEDYFDDDHDLENGKCEDCQS